MERHITYEHVEAWLRYIYRTRNHDKLDNAEIVAAVAYMPDDLVSFLARSVVGTGVTYQQEKDDLNRILTRAKEEWAKRAEKVLLEKEDNEVKNGDKNEHEQGNG